MPPEDVDELLQRRVVGVLSTLDRHGYPHSVGIYFAPYSDCVAMWVYGKSQKVRNVERDPRASLVVEDGQPYVDLRGVLIRGKLEIVRDPERVAEVGWAVYERYFAAASGHPFEGAAAEEMRKRSQKRVVLELPMARVTSWDHARAR